MLLGIGLSEIDVAVEVRPRNEISMLERLESGVTSEEEMRRTLVVRSYSITVPVNNVVVFGTVVEGLGTVWDERPNE